MFSSPNCRTIPIQIGWKNSQRGNIEYYTNHKFLMASQSKRYWNGPVCPGRDSLHSQTRNEPIPASEARDKTIYESVSSCIIDNLLSKACFPLRGDREWRGKWAIRNQRLILVEINRRRKKFWDGLRVNHKPYYRLIGFDLSSTAFLPLSRRGIHSTNVCLCVIYLNPHPISCFTSNCNI